VHESGCDRQAGQIPLLALRAWMEWGQIPSLTLRAFIERALDGLCDERHLKLEPNVIPPGGLEAAGIVLGHRA